MNRTDLITLAQPYSTHQLDKLFFLTWLVSHLSHTIMIGKYFKFAGVSTDLHVTYVSAATLGMVLLLECKVVKVGAGLANTTAVLKEKNTGRVLATGTHTKFNTDSRMKGGWKM